MSEGRTAKRLLLIGAGPRVAGAMVIIVFLWLGYLWATATPGSL